MPRTLQIVLTSNQEKRETRIDGEDDFTDELKKKAAAYAVEKTAKNTYPLTSQYSETTKRNTENTPPLESADKNGQKTFVSSTGDVGKSQLETASNSNLFNFKVVKGKQAKVEMNSYTGQELLNELNNSLNSSNQTNSLLAKEAERVVFENNGGYNETITYTKEKGSQKSDRNFVLGKTQFSKPGVFPGRKYPSITEDDIAKKSTLSIKDLTKLGTLMMLEASGESFIPDPTDPAFEVAAELSATAPAIARTFGGKVSTSRFGAISAIKRVKKDYKETNNTTFISSEKLSYGNTNSSLAMFDGLTSVSSITTTLLLIGTVSVSILGISAIINGIKEPEITSISNQPPNDRKKFLGSWRGKDNQHLSTFLKVININLPPVTHKPAVALRKGLEVFFGQTAGLGNTAAQAAGNVAAGIAATVPQIHGYYSTVLRAITRSLLALGYRVGDIAADQNSTVGDIRQAADPLVLIKKLNSSPLMAFIHILLLIGDKALTQEENKILYGGDDSTSDFISSIDSIKETLTEIPVELRSDGQSTSQTILNPAVLIAKSRLSKAPNDGRLSIANSTARSLFYMPKDLAVGLNPESDSVRDAVATISKYNTVKREGGKIDKEILAQMEKHLESDYMPFYFQDTRTNEVVSFHAFLEGITEDLTADYTESEGFGRLGKTYSYKNTYRNIGFSFTLLATSDEDFDVMWYKINRLAMLLYPQWSEGRRVTYQGRSFIQPFSQVIAASPMVRLRLGDLWKTNYNKVSVARLFGLGTSSFNMGTGQQQQQRLIDARINTELSADHSLYTPGEIVAFHGTNSHYPWVDGSNNVIGSTPVINSITVRIVADVPNQPSFKIVEYQYPQPGVQTRPRFKVPASELQRIPAEVRRRLGAQSSQQTNTETDKQQFDSESAVREFFSVENNPILRSFDSAMGTGIAGFVKSMRMGYNHDKLWATHKLNSRAPMMVKIDMEFALIHDLQPGLSSDGFMSAPIWNVGGVMKNLTGDQNTGEQFAANRSALAGINSSTQRIDSQIASTVRTIGGR
jgi:hypothetical protein